MTRAIRHEIPVDDQAHEVPWFWQILHVDCRDPRIVELWVQEPDPPHPSRAGRSFVVVGTGQPWPSGATFVGTALTPQLDGALGVSRRRGEVVWHLLEVTQ